MQGRIAHAATQWLNAALGLVYPESCQLCGAAAGPAQGFVCQNCRDSVRFIERPFCERCGRPFEGAITGEFECATCLESKWHFLSARSAVVAKGNARTAILDYKYKRALWFETFLAGLLIERAAPELAKAHWDAIVPVPLHPTKLREREFNQAERLAARLGKAVNLPVKRRWLKRIVPTSTQTRLPRKERLENVRNAFAMCSGIRLNGERIVLIDDVFTTGATTSSCARILKAAGASEVCVWTVARGI